MANLKERVHIVCRIISLSLQSGRASSIHKVPSKHKVANVRHLLKNRPWTNHQGLLSSLKSSSSLSKLMKCAVSNQLVPHIQENNVSDKFPSTYWQNCSTELTLPKEKQASLMHFTKERLHILSLYIYQQPLTDPLNTIFFNRLDTRFDMKGTVLKCFKDCLIYCTQWVLIGNKDIDGNCSDTINLQYGVPWGSILGSTFFMLHTTWLGDTCKKHNLNYHI